MVKWLSANYGQRSFLNAETLTLSYGLSLTWSSGIKWLEVNIDSQVVVDRIKTPVNKNQLHFFIVKECQDFINRPSRKVSLKHCHHEVNKALDKIVNFGLDQTIPLMIFGLLLP